MQHTQYALQSDTGAGPSPAIWGDCPWLRILEGSQAGKLAYDDFCFHQHIDLEAHMYGLDESDANATVSILDAAILRLALSTTDNEEIIAQAGASSLFPFTISDTAATAWKLWFETRIRVSAITDNVCGIVVGLADTNLAAGANAFQADDTAALADIGFIGFQTLQADGDSIDFVYRKNGQTMVQKIDGLAALVASTWIKLGFLFDPLANASERIRIFANGTEHGTKVTGTNIATATFPDTVYVNFAAGAKVGSAAALNFDVDWWRCAQLR